MKNTVLALSLACLTTSFVARAQNTIMPPVPGTNLPPIVRIVSPPNGAVFLAPANIFIAAQAFDYDGQVVSVEFFEGSNSLGVFVPPPPAPGTMGSIGSMSHSNRPPPNPFSLVWSNVPVGVYRLSALATDEDGARSHSAPVMVTVRDRNTNPPPVTNVTLVDIAAVDSWATEGANHPSRNALFVVRRSGPTNDSLTVNLGIGGSASNGVDYATIADTVTIPAGIREARIVVEPIDDTAVEGMETVVISVRPPPCVAIFPPPPGCYLAGPRARATAYIVDNDRPENFPPFVRLVHPMNGQRFPLGAAIPLRAEAFDRDGTIASVEFFADGVSVGNGTSSGGTTYTASWSGAAQGTHVVMAKATDDKGARAASNPARIYVGTITVTNVPPPIPTNIVVRPPQAPRSAPTL